MKDDTKLTHAGSSPREHQGVLNPPVYHASTVLAPDLDTFEGKVPVRMRYGRQGTPTTFALEDALTALEGGEGTVLTPSGLAAVGTALMACARAGDHVLISDNVYSPTRQFCDWVLSRYGIEAEYYDPLIGAGIAARIRPNTTVVFTESPGSQTFEVQDLPAIAQAAHTRGVRIIMDNTWGAGYFFKALGHGADLAVHACTKYVSGHSDIMLGAIVCDQGCFSSVRDFARLCGNATAPDDAYLALRGMRTMAVRLQRHQDSGLRIGRWLQDRPEVLRVMHPALSADPGHGLWQRDFTGACGLFGFVLKPVSRQALAAMLDGMRYFGMGYSWGGYESLLIPTFPERYRTATHWEPGGQTMRIHVGLEDPQDLIADLEAGFERLGVGMQPISKARLPTDRNG
jgi:cystathionine beta-lyase